MKFLCEFYGIYALILNHIKFTQNFDIYPVKHKYNFLHRHYMIKVYLILIKFLLDNPSKLSEETNSHSVKFIDDYAL